jgi:hypothetical protein
MRKIAGSLPVKTRVPLAGWVLAGLVTLFSIVSSLQFASAPSVAQQTAKKFHQASVNY